MEGKRLYGDTKSVGGDVLELRLTIGKGYRIYFYEANDDQVLILWGGDKKTQSKDIEKAKAFLKTYLEEQ